MSKEDYENENYPIYSNSLNKKRKEQSCEKIQENSDKEEFKQLAALEDVAKEFLKTHTWSIKKGQTNNLSIKEETMNLRSFLGANIELLRRVDTRINRGSILIRYLDDDKKNNNSSLSLFDSANAQNKDSIKFPHKYMNLTNLSLVELEENLLDLLDDWYRIKNSHVKTLRGHIKEMNFVESCNFIYDLTKEQFSKLVGYLNKTYQKNIHTHDVPNIEDLLNISELISAEKVTRYELFRQGFIKKIDKK